MFKQSKFSFSQKLILHTLITTAIALVLASAGLGWYEIRSMKDLIVQRLQTDSENISHSITAAIRFGDQSTTTEALKILKNEPNVINAVVFVSEGKQFAIYKRNESSIDPPGKPQKPGYKIEGNLINVSYEIKIKGETIGVINLQRDLNDISQRLWRYAGIVLLVFIVSLLIAMLSTVKILKALTRPINELLAKATLISSRKDYSIRAEKLSGDELGTLTDSFNEMLNQIQKRDSEVNQIRRNLQKTNEELKNFIRTASHDFQEPLRKIVVFGDRILQFDRAMSKEERFNLQRIQNASFRLQNLFSDLQSYSKVVSTAKIEHRPIDLKKLINQIIDDLELIVEEKGAHVITENVPEFEADEFQMMQLFQNIISNALKYSRKDVPPVIKVFGGVDSNNYCEIHIQDNGLGFDEKYFDKVFKPFERLHRHNEIEGSGVGLTICQKIVEQHGGSIKVSSTPMKGTTFTIRLPLKQDKFFSKGNDG